MQFKGLLDRNNAKIVGLPKGFDFEKALRSANHIYFLMAFAKTSGWNRIRNHLLKSSTQITCVAGRNFAQTEPALLKDWLSNKYYGRLTPYIYDKSKTFHPKVIMFEWKNQSVGIIGSGNLTNGGFSSNIECGYFIDSSDISSLRELKNWINQITNSVACKHLTPDRLAEYEKYYSDVAKSRKTIAGLENSSRAKFSGNVTFNIPNFQKCVTSLVRMKNSQKYQNNKKMERRHAITYLQKIYKELRLAPNADSSKIRKKNWDCMYGQVPLGTVREAEAPKAAQNLTKLRRAIDLLKDPTISAPERLGLVVHGPNSVQGIGRAIASKILLSLDRINNPIMNGAVLGVLEDKFHAQFTGRKNRSASVPRVGHEYRAFREIMIDLRKQAGFDDMIELDRALWLMKP